MEPIKIPGANLLLKAPEGMENCGDLHAHASSDGVTSAWQMTPEELERARVNGGVVYVHVASGVASQPPIAIYVPEQSEQQNLIFWPQSTMTLFEKFEKAVSLARNLKRRIALQLPDCAYIVDGSKDAADVMEAYENSRRSRTCT